MAVVSHAPLKDATAKLHSTRTKKGKPRGARLFGLPGAASCVRMMANMAVRFSRVPCTLIRGGDFVMARGLGVV